MRHEPNFLTVAVLGTLSLLFLPLAAWRRRRPRPLETRLWKDILKKA